MIDYGRISSKIWKSVVGFESSNEINRDEMGYLDYQIRQWEAIIPESLRFDPNDALSVNEATSRGHHRLRVLVYLRRNQLRIFLYRPVLQSASSLMGNRSQAQTVVELAQDSIRVLTHLNQTSDIYRTQQVCFNYFLVSALATLFLAVSHFPLEFSAQVRDEFYMALDLVKGFSGKSFIAKRLWHTIRGLKEVGPKLGLVSSQSMAATDDPHSSAAVAMAGLAGHPVDELAAFPSSIGPLGSNTLNGQQMSYELTNLFEAVGGHGNGPPNHAVDGHNEFGNQNGEMPTDGNNMPQVFGNEEDFAKIMGECFYNLG
jgi:hypothetical protein